MLWFFLIYAFLGWCLEVTYQAVEYGVFINRGFLGGPYCPIYGVGVIVVTLALYPLRETIILLYVGSVVLTSSLEFVTGFILEKIFHQHWWDYSDDKFNVKGYICLKFSLLWGVACLVTVRIIHPARRTYPPHSRCRRFDSRLHLLHERPSHNHYGNNAHQTVPESARRNISRNAPDLG